MCPRPFLAGDIPAHMHACEAICLHVAVRTSVGQIIPTLYSDRPGLVNRSTLQYTNSAEGS